MIQETFARKRSSGSSSRRKKSQRLIINPPKLPRLILNPPKPPQQQQQNTVKMVFRPPRSSSPEADHLPSDWADADLIGNGVHASYDYGDICKVQAIMKVFNGLSSATRKVEVSEQKLNGNEPADVIMAETEAISHSNDRARTQLEMNDILQEALDCHHCEKNIYLKPEAMETDVRHGIYRCSEDPPFLLNRPYDDVAPDEMPEEVSEPGYLQLATIAQQEQYLQLVEHHIERNRAKKLFSGIELKADQGYESRFAFYCVDFHIHQHYVHRRSVLNYCRTNEEMEDIRYWKYKLALWTAHHNSQLSVQTKEIHVDLEDENELSVTTSSTTDPIQMIRKEQPEVSDPFSTMINLSGAWSATPPSPTSSIFSSSPMVPSSPSTAASSPPKASSFPNPTPPIILPWPTQQLTISNQISLHRHLSNPRERAARVRNVRRRFRETMQQRALQRRDGLIIANYEAAFALQKWHRNRGGPLAMQREGNVGELLKRYNR